MPSAISDRSQLVVRRVAQQDERCNRDSQQTHIAQAQGTSKSDETDNHATGKNTTRQEDLDIPELLRFAGSMVPEPSTTSPTPFIVA